MEDIRFYDFEFNLLHIEPRFLSVNWEVYYNDVGTFEAHFPLMDSIVGLVMAHRYLVAVQGSRAAVVTTKQLGGDLAVFGRTCSWLLTRRTVAGFSVTNAAAEATVKGKVAEGFPELSLGSGPAGLTQPISYACDGRTLLFDAVQGCLDLAGGGHEVVFDTNGKAWVFRVLSGRELDLVISEGNRNAHNVQYDDDLLEYFSGGYFKNQPEAAEGQEQPPATWEPVIKDSAAAGLYKWDCVLSGASEAEARLELARQKRKLAVRAETHGLQCGRDYQLGDIVTLQVEKGAFQAASQKRITGVHLWYEGNDSGESPIFEEEDLL